MAVPQNFVHAPADSNFVETSRFDVRGFRTEKGGCGFRREGVIRAGESYSERMVAVNPATCEAVFAVGERQRPAVLFTRPSSGQDSHTVATPNLSNPVYGFYHTVITRDPIYLKIAELEHYLSYESGYCVDYVGSYPEVYYAEWNNWILNLLTDWNLDSCGKAYRIWHAAFSNSTFCAPFTTFVRKENEIEGHLGGYGVWRYTWSAEGGCYWLLWVHNDYWTY